MKRILPVGLLIVIGLIAVGFLMENIVPWFLHPIRIAVQAHGGRDNQGIYQFDPRWQKFTRLTPDNILAYRPTWSSDGMRLAYIYRIGFEESGIGLIDLEIGASKIIVRTQYSDNLRIDSDHVHLAWSPDNQAILFNAFNNESESLYLVEVSSGQIKNLNLNSDHQRTMAFAWSSAGKLVMEKDGQIFLADIETGEVKFLVNGYAPFWKPGDTQLAFVCDLNSGQGLCIIEPNTGETKILYQPQRWYIAPYQGIFFTSNGRFVVYQERGGESDPIRIKIYNVRTSQVHQLYESYWLDEIIVEEIALPPN